MSDQRWSSRCTLSDSKHNNEIASLNFRTGWSVGEHTFAWSSKHTLPRLARSTLNELQQNQHEKASLVCVRVQSPSGLAMVPCALSMVDLSGQLRCWITHTQTSLVQINALFFERSEFLIYFWHPMLVRPVMKRLFFPWKTKEKKARFARAPHYYRYLSYLLDTSMLGVSHAVKVLVLCLLVVV